MKIIYERNEELFEFFDNQTFLTIDPGVNTAFCFCCNSQIVLGIETTNKNEIQSKIKDISNATKCFLNIVEEELDKAGKAEISTVSIEIPRFFSGSQKSFDSVNSNSLMILAMITGGIISTITSQDNVLWGNFFGWTPVQWKGQLSKKMVSKRVKDFFKIELKNEHIIDALGMVMSELSVL